MFWSIWRVIGRFFNRDYIPPLPRMYSSDFAPDELTDDERRALARLGARDPRGLRLAMKRHGVDTLQDLIAVLEHHQPKRRVWHRLTFALGRMVGGVPYDPHGEDIGRLHKRKNDDIIARQRIREILKEIK